MDIIHLLPDSIANQIAAGEVVQRPSSVVKELIENSIDAKATSVTLLVREAGRALLQVMDNGSGMSETDVRMSLERHATSKIKSADDLFALHTMGFRGEALASIAAVAQVEIKTRTAHSEIGTRLAAEASEVKKQEPTACEKGTSIAVKNLFFNVPARRNFLKSNAREYDHIVDEFIRLAIANPDMAFKLINEKETVYDLPPSKLSQRIVNLLGKQYQDQLAPCQEETTWIKVTGYIGRPESARKSRGGQYIFVNKRFIKNSSLSFTVLRAYEGLLAEKTYPFYVLFIDIDPKKIDVNVHPTKTEIKFDEERAVTGMVWSAVKRALGVGNLSPSLDFSADVNLMQKFSPEQQQAVYRERFPSDPNQPHWKKLFDSPLTEPEQRFESKINSPEETNDPSARPTFQWQNKYLVVGMKEKLLVIEQQLASECILYEKYLQTFETGGASQQLLFPITVSLPPADFALMMEMQKELTVAGFQLEEFGKYSLLISGVPVEASSDEKELVEGLLEQFKQNQSLQLPLKSNLARSLARRFSVKAGKALAHTEIDALIGRLFSCKNSKFAPDGRPAYFVLEGSQMESYFAK